MFYKICLELEIVAWLDKDKKNTIAGIRKKSHDQLTTELLKGTLSSKTSLKSKDLFRDKAPYPSS
jgi:hypothetical protein